MLDLEEVSQWVLDRLSGEDVLEVWVFGSVLGGDCLPNDVDVFVKHRDGESGSIPAIRSKLESGFFARFGVPLHLLFLSHAESTEADEFLRKALRSGIRVR